MGPEQVRQLKELFLPCDEVAFTVFVSGDGKNPYQLGMLTDIPYGVEIVGASAWSAWEKMLQGYDPFQNPITNKRLVPLCEVLGDLRDNAWWRTREK